MKSVLGATMIAALATGLASTAHGSSALDKTQALARKYGMSISDQAPKALCVCLNANNQIGALLFTPNDTVGGTMGCYILRFGSDGSLIGNGFCTSWLPVTK
jgi:hypothetical protein